MSPISFPELGISVNPDPVAFTVLGKEIYWYGIIIALGFVLAVFYASHRAHDFGLTEDIVLDMLFVAVPAAIIFARLYYCVFQWEMYADNPVSVLYIWEGGIAIYGAVIGASVAVFLFCRHRKLPSAPLLDVGGLGLMIGQMIGRWGNFMNREAYGAETDAFLRMGLADGGKMIYVHPTFLYESLWNLVGFFVLHFYSKKRKFDGQIFLLYLTWYGLGRAWIEGLRTDSLYFFGTAIRVSQLLAFLCFLICGTWVIYVTKFKKPDPQNLYVNKSKKSSEIAGDTAE